MVPTYRDEVVILRTHKLGEADRIVTMLSRRHGKIRAVAKGVRRTSSRFGARLEPFSHAELLLHQGSGELHTVTGASLVDAHRPTREDSYRLAVGLVGAEAMLRLFVEEERNERAFEALHAEFVLQPFGPVRRGKLRRKPRAVPVREPLLETVVEKLRPASVGRASRHLRSFRFPLNRRSRPRVPTMLFA